MKKKYFILLILFFKIVLNAEPIQKNSDIDFNKEYLLLINTAYSYYNDKKYEKSMIYYKQSKLYAQTKTQSLNSNLGLQNCLIKLKKFYKAVILGKEIMKTNLGNITLLLNMGYSYFSLKHYEVSNKYYYLANLIEPDNLLVLKGLFWNFYYLEDEYNTKKYAEFILKKEPGNKIIINFCNKLLEKFSYNLSSFFTYYNYSSAIKKNGQQYDIIFSSDYKKKFFYNIAYSNANINFADTTPKIKEDYFLFRTVYSSKYPFCFSFKKIISNQDVLGDGTILYGSIDISKFFLQTAFSKYDTTKSNQIGIGYNYKFKKLYFLTMVDFIHIKEITGIYNSKNYATVSQKINYWKLPYKIAFNFNVGKNMTLVHENSFVVNNAPEENSWSANFNISYIKKKYEFGYNIGFIDSKNVLVNDKFNLLSQSINFNLRW